MMMMMMMSPTCGRGIDFLKIKVEGTASKRPLGDLSGDAGCRWGDTAKHRCGEDVGFLDLCEDWWLVTFKKQNNKTWCPIASPWTRICHRHSVVEVIDCHHQVTRVSDSNSLRWRGLMDVDVAKRMKFSQSHQDGLAIFGIIWWGKRNIHDMSIIEGW